MVTAVQSPEDQESHPQNGHDPRTNGHTIDKLYWKTQVPLRTREIVFHFSWGATNTEQCRSNYQWYILAVHPMQNLTHGSQQWIPVLQPNFLLGPSTCLTTLRRKYYI